MSMVLMDVSDNSAISVLWHGLGTATITAVVYFLPSPLTHTDVSINNNSIPPHTNLTVTGVEHGQTYMCEAQATLSTGEVLNRQFTIKGFNN